ncbi:hypothetical protein [Intestinimonas timonensis]|uniref:hypothetical protein n=1 Tax=Intestinimonas timonensis TaxID=1689270 RepID=UPI001030ED72|nr:hypothetical protein [Intestinimonas timonensis]
MYYYVIDKQNVVINSIVLEEDADPTIFGAIADDRVFDIGDTWTPPPTEAQLLGQEITELQLEQIAQGQMMTELQLTQLEGGTVNV